jgi:hypothetical protein
MVAIFSLLIPTIAFWLISVICGRRQRSAVQAIEGGLEALASMVLFVPLISFLINSLRVQAIGFLGNLIVLGVLQLIYVLLRSRVLRRQQHWAKLKGFIATNIIIDLLFVLFYWLITILEFPT